MLPLRSRVSETALFRVTDFYTATFDDQGDLIPGVKGARIVVQNERVLTVRTTVFTGPDGEILVPDLPSGSYRYRVSSPGHHDLGGRFVVQAGVVTSVEVPLKNDVISVEFSVVPVTIEDSYDIVLRATFETDVPAAVVVVEPMSTTLPPMDVGDVFNGQYTLVNHGLVRADSVQWTPSTGNAFYRYEVLADIPDTLEARQEIIVPYRITLLASPDGAEETGNGGGCLVHRFCDWVSYLYTCANGTTYSDATGPCLHSRPDRGCGVGVGRGNLGLIGVPFIGSGPSGNNSGGRGGGGDVALPIRPKPDAIEGACECICDVDCDGLDDACPTCEEGDRLL